MNAMTAAATLGTINMVFLTVTANPDWDAIKYASDGCSPADRPDITARVFEGMRRRVRADLIRGAFCPAGTPPADYYIDITE